MDLWQGMRFAAISLWQPYASLPLVDAKPWETRNRPYPAKYHGRRVLVASTAAFTPRSVVTPALHELCGAVFGDDYQDTLPRGQALYTIVLKGCERTEDMAHKVPPELLASGDFSPGRFAWEWGDVEPLNPFPVKGGQGWWFCDVTDGAFCCAHDAAARERSEHSSPRQVGKEDEMSSSVAESGGTASPKSDGLCKSEGDQ